MRMLKNSLLIAGIVAVVVSLPLFASAQLAITGVFDGPLTGGIPKGIELVALEDIADLSLYGVGSASNGGGTDGVEFVFPADALSAGDVIYLATEDVGFTEFFGFAPTYVDAFSVSINGDDAMEVFFMDTVIDTFGEIDVDGTGMPWEYLDGWAYRVNNSLPQGAAFVIADWTFSGINNLEGGTTNDTCIAPFPLGTFTTVYNGVVADENISLDAVKALYNR